MREFSKDGVDGALAECAEVAHLQALGALCAGHDRAVAAEFFEDLGELNIGTFAGCGADPCAKIGDGRNRGELIAGAGALIDRVHDLVDEAVDADQGLFRTSAVGVGFEFLQSECFAIH